MPSLPFSVACCWYCGVCSSLCCIRCVCVFLFVVTVGCCVVVFCLLCVRVVVWRCSYCCTGLSSSLLFRLVSFVVGWSCLLSLLMLSVVVDCRCLLCVVSLFPMGYCAPFEA